MDLNNPRTRYYYQTQKTHPASILQHWCWQNSACQLCHFIMDNNTKLLQVRIRSTNHAVTFYLVTRKEFM